MPAIVCACRSSTTGRKNSGNTGLPNRLPFSARQPTHNLFRLAFGDTNGSIAKDQFFAAFRKLERAVIQSSPFPITMEVEKGADFTVAGVPADYRVICATENSFAELGWKAVPQGVQRMMKTPA